MLVVGKLDACRSTGFDEQVHEGRNGLLVSPGVEDDLAAALEKLMVDEPLRRRLAFAARTSILAKGMTRQAMIAKYLKIYGSTGA